MLKSNGEAEVNAKVAVKENVREWEVVDDINIQTSQTLFTHHVFMGCELFPH